MSKLLKHNICDGINLYYIEDKKYKTVAASIYLHRHIKRDEVTKNALLTGVLQSGTQKYPTMKEISRHLENLYGTVYGMDISRKGDIQSIRAGFSVLDEKIVGENILPDVLDLMFEFLFNPALENGVFVERYVETEKKNLKDSIESLVNDKRAYASLRCLEHMCKGESAGISEFGYIEDLPSLNAENLYEHYKKIITTSPIDIFVVGDCNIDDVKAKIGENISRYNFAIEPIERERADVKKTEVKNIDESFDVAQGKLVMGLRTHTDLNDSMYYPLLVGNSIFGGGAHSKLFCNVREKSSLAYYVSSKLDKFSGIMIIGSGIEFSNFERAKKEILKELDDVKAGLFTDEELRIAKNALIDSLRSYYDSIGMMSGFYLGQMLYGNEITIEEAIEKIDSVTADQVKDAFERVELDTVYFLKGRE